MTTTMPAVVPVSANPAQSRVRVVITRIVPDLMLLGIIGVLLSVLSVTNKNVNRLNGALKTQAETAMPKVGDYLPEVPAVRIGSEEQEVLALSAVQLPAVIYFFAPDCKFCADERSQLPALAALSENKGYHFAAISTAPPNETRRMFPNPTSFPILSESGGQIGRNYRVVATPMFLVVAGSRRVNAVHMGVLEPSGLSPLLYTTK